MKLMPLKLLSYLLAIPAVAVIRLIKPWLLVRYGPSSATASVTLRVIQKCTSRERDAGINKPMQRHVDLFYPVEPICNQQLLIMWKRVLHVWPAQILVPIARVNRLIPGGAVHEIGNNSQGAYDVHNLLDRFRRICNLPLKKGTWRGWPAGNGNTHPGSPLSA